MKRFIPIVFLIAIIATPPFSVATLVRAQEETSPDGEVSSLVESATTDAATTTSSDTSTEATATDSASATASSSPSTATLETTSATSIEEQSAGVDAETENSAASSTPALLEEVPSKTKFTKNNDLSPEEQLAAVRKHLLDNKLPTIALDRLTAYEAQRTVQPEENGLLKKVVDFVTGNTDAAREQKAIEKLIKQKPFNVETFEGKIKTAPLDQYEKDFVGAKEQGTLIQKVRNLIENGTLFNSDFDQTEEQSNILSRLFGSNKALAEASADPDDYLAAGNEITFSQAIKDQANALGKDPLRMLNFVRNEVEYVPYYGSKKGSDATLIEHAGNDMDQASLLIAMLRYSGVPARYRHVDAKMSVNTVTGLVGVDSAIAAAKILSLNKIPYVLYTLNDEPYFFVIEHTFVEAYMPYGYSRGADATDGGVSEWVPMDPSIADIYHERLTRDVLDDMRANGFDIETFFDNYLGGEYGSLEPVEAFRSVMVNYIQEVAGGNEDLIFALSLIQKIPSRDELAFVPGTLPYEMSANLDTYAYVPQSLRHSIMFSVSDENGSEVLNHVAYVSDVADSELLITYKAASVEDQAIIDSFDTVYDVVPLSIVAVKPVVEIAGELVAIGTATTTLGRAQDYSMVFESPRRTMGETVTREVDKTIEKDTITGITDAIALNTDRILPLELRPHEDTGADDFLANRMLHHSALDYLDRLQHTHRELAAITGGDFTNVVTRATIFNGIAVTYDNGEPYSFDWKGLRIDASSSVRYFHRFSEDIKTNRKEFIAMFGLQASQDESDIFEDNFDVESVATAKGLKLVSSGTFPGITLKKITAANESEIDSLSVSAGTKAAFHTAIAEGKIIYTPSAPVTYGEWNGLFYVSVDFEGGDGTYAIGEGLNGGYSICGVTPGGLCTRNSEYVSLLQKYVDNIRATLISPLVQSIDYTDSVDLAFECKGIVGGQEITWKETISVQPSRIGTVSNSLFLRAKCDPSRQVTVRVTWSDVGELAFGFIPIIGAAPEIWNAHINNTFTDSGISSAEKIFSGGFILMSLSGGNYGKLFKAMAGFTKGAKGSLQLLEDAGGIKRIDGRTIYPHTISTHVEFDKGRLQARAQQERGIPAATAFYTKAQADKYAHEAYLAKRGEIESWARNSGPEEVTALFTYNIPNPSEKFGHGYLKGGSSESYRDDITTVEMRFIKSLTGAPVLESAYPLYPF